MSNAVIPELGEGPTIAPGPTMIRPATSISDGESTRSRAARPRVTLQKAYGPPPSSSVAPGATRTSPYAPAASVTICANPTVTGAPGLQAGKTAGKPHAAA